MAKKTPASPKNSMAKLNETGRRGNTDRRQSTEAIPVVERRKAPRRRQIDPTTCERDYTDAEIEFMHALDQYKRASGRMFPTCSEILEVLLNLGYRKVGAADLSPATPCPGPVGINLSLGISSSSDEFVTSG